jgi:hypothetical protein
MITVQVPSIPLLTYQNATKPIKSHHLMGFLFYGHTKLFKIHHKKGEQFGEHI